MLSCYFDVLGICEMFSTEESIRPCLCEKPCECDFYLSDEAVHLVAKKYAVKRAVKKCLDELGNSKDGE